MSRKRALVAQSDDRALVDRLSDYALDPLGFVQAVFPWGEGALESEPGPDQWQAHVLTALGETLRGAQETSDAARFAVASGHGVGKTALSAWLVLWFLSTRDHPQVVVTANTAAQLRNKTWRELAKWHRLAANKHWFAWTSERFAFVENPETWFAAAVPWSKDRPEAFAGTHDKHVLMLFDEASAIADEIWDVTEGAMSTPGALWIALGNPTRNSGRFRECFRRYRHRWTTRTVDSRQARKANGAQLKRWVEDYGEDSDFVRVRVRGVFPRAGNSQFIGEDLIAAAKAAEPHPSPDAALVLGIDVARYGDDASLILARAGSEIVEAASYRGLDTMQLAGRIAEAIVRLRPDGVMVDGGGVGAGVVDRLRQLGHRVTDVNAGSRALDDARHVNLRVEMWAKMRDWLKGGGCLAGTASELADDLAGPDYGFDAKGRLKLESKEDMKSRGLASPDWGDALALTFAYPVRPRSFDARRPHYALFEYDELNPPR
ncbi:MAG TPA: terminase [Alphaproteobacteria bacterium]|nr:terminase [Alphaproteobacteria bacterium]